MKTGDDGQRFIRLDQKHKYVWKVPEQGAAHVLVHGGELLRIGSYALNRSIHFSTEAMPETLDFALVPILRVD